MMVFSLLFLLQGVPLWIFLIPGIVLTAVSVRFWKRPVARNTCIAVCIPIALLAIPPCAVQAYLRTGGSAALERRFGHVIDGEHVTKYRFVIAGLGDTCEFWKLKGVDANSCQQLIDGQNLEPVSFDST